MVCVLVEDGCSGVRDVVPSARERLLLLMHSRGSSPATDVNTHSEDGSEFSSGMIICDLSNEFRRYVSQFYQILFMFIYVSEGKLPCSLLLTLLASFPPSSLPWSRISPPSTSSCFLSFSFWEMPLFKFTESAMRTITVVRAVINIAKVIESWFHRRPRFWLMCHLTEIVLGDILQRVTSALQFPFLLGQHFMGAIFMHPLEYISICN